MEYAHAVPNRPAPRSRQMLPPYAGRSESRYTRRAQRVIADVISIAAVVAIMVLIATLSASILPPVELLDLALLLGAVLWRWFIRLHARPQVALLETFAGEREHY